MGFCKKCGAYYDENDELCYHCGAKINDPEEVPSKDELLKELDAYRLILDEYEYLKAVVKPESNYSSFQPTRTEKRSFIRYFWPFLVISFIAFCIINAGARSICDTSCCQRYLAIGFFVAIAIALVILLYGYGFAKRKQAEVNRDASIMNALTMDLYTIGQANQEKVNRLRELSSEKSKYDHLVPEGYRDFDHVAKIQELIMQDKASSVEEAIAIINAI